MTTLSISERLTEVESRIPNARERAEAEAARMAATGDGGRWNGAAKLLDDLECEAKDLRLQLRGLELTQAEDTLTALETEIARCTMAKGEKSSAVDEAKAHPVIVRWLKADETARVRGHGHTWAILRPWIVSCRPKTAAPPQVGAMQFSDWPQELRFTDPEREVIARFLEAKDEEQRAELELANAHERHRQLLDAHPELKPAS